MLNVSNRVVRAPSPRARLPQPFKILDEVIEEAFTSLKRPVAENTHFVQFQLALFDRAFNGLKAIHILLERGYWESAVGVSRQLLDLSMSVERIFFPWDGGDPEELALRFIKFGLLQNLRHLRARGSYEAERGYQSTPDIDSMTNDDTLVAEFPEFMKGRRKDGSINWMSNWCDKTARQMAHESRLDTRRMQYELLYTSWSEEMHAAPSALMTNIFPETHDDWAQGLLWYDDRKIVEVTANAVNIFLEIWISIPEARLRIDRKWTESIMSRLKRIEVPTYSSHDD